MSNKFQLIIDSNDRKSGISSDCIIAINCPKLQSMTNKLRCEVLLFSISYPPGQKPNASYVKLSSSNLSLYNQYSQKHILSIYDTLSYRYSRTTFECDNYSDRDVNFRLMDETNSQFLDFYGDPYDYPWILILECEEI